ncbi:MAG: PD-(D/E)XK nuclease family protein, partial [Pseudanabaena sp.]
MVLQERKSAMTAITPITSISQDHLNIWEACRRKYQYSFLEVLILPEVDLDRKEKLQLGAKFHLLMQQKEIGLDISALASSDAQLQTWLNAFEKRPPAMIAGDRLCEHRRTLDISDTTLHDDSENRERNQGHFVLTAIYDMVILGDCQAQILDWKTHQAPIPFHKLKANWQTRLYL